MSANGFRAAGFPWRLYCGRQVLELSLKEAVARASTALNILQQTGASIGTAVLTVLLASALPARERSLPAWHSVNRKTNRS